MGLTPPMGQGWIQVKYPWNPFSKQDLPLTLTRFDAKYTLAPATKAGRTWIFFFYFILIYMCVIYSIVMT